MVSFTALSIPPSSGGCFLSHLSLAKLLVDGYVSLLPLASRQLLLLPNTLH